MSLKENLTRMIDPVLKKQGDIIAPSLNPVKYESQKQTNLIKAMLSTSTDDTIETPLSDMRNTYLQNAKGGILSIDRVLGKTILVNEYGEKVSTPAHGCRFLSVGENEIGTLKFTSKTKNIFNNEIVKGSIDMKGEETTWQEYWKTMTYIEVDPGITIKFSSKYNGIMKSGYIYEYDKDKKYLKTTYQGANVPLTIGINTKYIRLGSLATNTGVPIILSSVSEIQLTLNAANDDYVSYEEHKRDFYIGEPLREIPGGNFDEIKNNQIIRRILSVKVTDKNYIGYWKSFDTNNTVCFYTTINEFGSYPNPLITNQAYCDCLPKSPNGVGSNDNYECFHMGTTADPPYIAMRIYKDKLKEISVEGIKAYLKDNPITFLVERKEPIIEDVKEPIALQAYKDGVVTIENDITPYVKYKYSGNIAFKEAINLHSQEIDTNKQDVDNYVFPLLMDMDYQVLVMNEAIDNMPTGGSK